MKYINDNLYVLKMCRIFEIVNNIVKLYKLIKKRLINIQDDETTSENK